MQQDLQILLDLHVLNQAFLPEEICCQLITPLLLTINIITEIFCDLLKNRAAQLNLFTLRNHAGYGI